MIYITIILCAALLSAAWRSLNAYRRLSRISPMLADLLGSVACTLLSGIAVIVVLVLTLGMRS